MIGTIKGRTMMSNKVKYLIASLSMILLVLLDATGDAFRLRHWMAAHHFMELLHVAGWFAIWALFGFKRVYILLYILARVALFDITFNPVAGLEPFYVGFTSLYDSFITWFSGLFKSAPGHFAFILTFMSSLAWVGVFIKNK